MSHILRQKKSPALGGTDDLDKGRERTISTPNSSTPITSKQISYLSKLIAWRGKAEYQAAKLRLGFPTKTIMKLSKYQAMKLIGELK